MYGRISCQTSGLQPIYNRERQQETTILTPKIKQARTAARKYYHTMLRNIQSGQERTVKKIVGREWRTCAGGERQVVYKINWGDKWQDTWGSEEMVRRTADDAISDFITHETAPKSTTRAKKRKKNDSEGD